MKEGLYMTKDNKPIFEDESTDEEILDSIWVATAHK